MNNDNDSEDDGLYDYTFTADIYNKREGHDYDFFYGTDLDSNNYVVIKSGKYHTFDRVMKVKDNENGVPNIEVDSGVDCYLRIHESSNLNYTAFKFNCENVRSVTIEKNGTITITPTVLW